MRYVNKIISKGYTTEEKAQHKEDWQKLKGFVEEQGQLIREKRDFRNGVHNYFSLIGSTAVLYNVHAFRENEVPPGSATLTLFVDITYESKAETSGSAITAALEAILGEEATDLKPHELTKFTS